MPVLCPKCNHDGVLQIKMKAAWFLINQPEMLGYASSRRPTLPPTIKLHYWCIGCGHSWFKSKKTRNRAANKLGALAVAEGSISVNPIHET